MFVGDDVSESRFTVLTAFFTCVNVAKALSLSYYISSLQPSGENWWGAGCRNSSYLFIWHLLLSKLSVALQKHRV